MNLTDSGLRSPLEIQTLLSLACIASCANLILVLLTHRPVAVIQAYGLEVLALVLALVLIYLNHFRTRTSSTLFVLFWPLYAVALFIWGRTVLTAHLHRLLPVLYIRCAVLTLGSATFALECLGPEFTEEDCPEKYVDGHTESPLLTANIFSVWTFSWMSSLMKKGAKMFITEDDLSSLRPQEQSANLGKKLQSALHTQ